MTEKLILGIETSCDDTSIAILKGNANRHDQVPELLALNSFSQEVLLKKWGGVVPEIAARNHLEKIHPLLEATLENSNIKLSEIDLFAVTTHYFDFSRQRQSLRPVRRRAHYLLEFCCRNFWCCGFENDFIVHMQYSLRELA